MTNILTSKKDDRTKSIALNIHQHYLTKNRSNPVRTVLIGGLVAQLVEHLIEAQGVGGSIPSQAIWRGSEVAKRGGL